MLAGKATLQEIDQHWTMEDVLDANYLLDFQAYIEWKETERVKRDMRNKNGNRS